MDADDSPFLANSINKNLRASPLPHCRIKHLKALTDRMKRNSSTSTPSYKHQQPKKLHIPLNLRSTTHRRWSALPVSKTPSTFLGRRVNCSIIRHTLFCWGRRARQAICSTTRYKSGSLPSRLFQQVCCSLFLSSLRFLHPPSNLIELLLASLMRFTTFCLALSA